MREVLFAGGPGERARGRGGRGPGAGGAAVVVRGRQPVGVQRARGPATPHHDPARRVPRPVVPDTIIWLLTHLVTTFCCWLMIVEVLKI